MTIVIDGPTATQQRADALVRANEVRSFNAALKKQIRAAGVRGAREIVAGIFERSSDDLDAAPEGGIAVGQLLLAMPGMGVGKAHKLLRRADMSGAFTRRVRAVSRERRRTIANLIRGPAVMATSDDERIGPFDVKLFADRFLLGLRFLASLEDDMAEFVETVGHAHAFGWVVDPTAYRDMLGRRGNMDDLAGAVRLAQPLVAKFRELQHLVEANA